MHNTRYDFSSVHVDVPLPLAMEIVEWGRRNVIDDELYVSSKDPTYGREDEIHVTILYGVHSESSEQVKSLLFEQGPITAKLGKIQVFTNPFKFDVVMIEVISPDLTRLNAILEQDVKFTNKYSSYNPHVTIAYVKKGKGWKHCGTPLWHGRKFTCEYVVFSSKAGFKEKITL